MLIRYSLKRGEYVYEVSLYKDNSKLTSASDKFKVNAEQVIIDGEIVETYTPMFDNLLSDLAGALQETDNIDIDVNKVGNTATVSITKKDGTEKNVEIYDGLKGDSGEDAKINGVNTLTIEAGTNITLDQEGNILTINSTGGGGGGTSNYNALTNKPKINNVELNGNKSLNELGIQPAGNYLTEETDPTVPSHVKNITQANITSWNNKSDFSGNYNDLTNKPTIPVVPTNVSAFTNDVGYLTQHQDITGKLNTSQVKNTMSTTAGDVYDVRYINTMIGNIETLLGEI